MGFLLAIGAAISFGSVGVFTRIGVQHIKPPGATLIALLSSSIVVTVFTIVLEMEIVRNVSLSGILWFAVIGILYFPMARNFFFLGVNSIGASRTSGIYASYPLFTVIFATLFLQENMTIYIMIGTLCIIGGLVLLATYGKRNNDTAGGHLSGYLFSLASAACYGVGMVIAKYAVSGFASPFTGAAISLWFGTAALSVVVIGMGPNIDLKNNKRSLIWLSISGLCSAVGLVCLYYAMTLTEAIMVTPLTGTSPLFTILGAHLFLQHFEKVTVRMIIGAFFVIIGSALIAIDSLG